MGNAEPTFIEALARIKKELAGVGAVVVALGGGAGWFGMDTTQKATQQVTAAESVSAELVKFYAPELGRCRMRVEDQKATCLQLLDNEREDTAHWRRQCEVQ